MRVAQVLMGLIFGVLSTLQLGGPGARQWAIACLLVVAVCISGAAARSAAAPSLTLAAALTGWAALITIQSSPVLSSLSIEAIAQSTVGRQLAMLSLGAGWCTITAVHATRSRWRADL
jgi:hypothetical protein